MRYNHLSMLPANAFKPKFGLSKGGMTLEGGGDGDSPPAPSPNTTQVTIPEYARPYMERLLGKAESLTGSPYQVYGGERLAEQDPLQQLAYENVYGMQTPSQFEPASGLAGAGGLSSLGAGQDYLYGVTDPSTMGAFMSPYMQNVVDVQKNAALRDAQKAQLVGDLGAARQGTYGGARQLLAGTERERSLLGQMSDIQAKGLQNSYEQAIKNMQFGTTAGLQGAQQATQAGAVLGQLGSAEQQAGLDLAKMQMATGQLQQDQQQKAYDMAYQDFLMQQQYPYKQLGFMSDLLRGSANLAGTGGKTVYEAPPSQLQSMVGPGLLGLGLYKEFTS